MGETTSKHSKTRNIRERHSAGAGEVTGFHTLKDRQKDTANVGESETGPLKPRQT